MKIRLLVPIGAAVLGLMMIGVRGAAAATTWVVDDDGVQCPSRDYMSIQAAISAVTTMSGDTIMVCPGTYTENVVLNKSLTLLGAQSTVDARGRISPNEAIITALAGTLLRLVTGSAGSTIDGFTFLAGSIAIDSATGPIDKVRILNNRILGFTGSGLFLNDNGIEITIDKNDIDGTMKVGAGDLVHLDQDNFDGLYFTNNRVANGLTATGFFVDGTRNVDKSTPGSRAPLFSGNVIDRNQTGVNLGRLAWGDGPITDNTISNNLFDGIQGGPKNSKITKNSFVNNGRNGLALTSFGNTTDPARGAQNNTIERNCFTRNGFNPPPNNGAGVLFSATQFPGTISTNKANKNNIVGNAMGARYPLPGAEFIDATNNWWGSANGPGLPDGSATGGDGVDGHGQIVFTPYSFAGFTGTPCSGPPVTTLTLEPAFDTNPVDTLHCVTATVTNAFGVPQQGITVRFTVTGPGNTSGSATTDANGKATFCYTAALPGPDTITAYADLDNDSMLDPGEPFDTATKVWVLPTTTPGCEINITNGGWIIADNGDRANFGGNAKADEDSNVSGQEEYQDQGPADPFNLHGDVTVIACDTMDSTRATIFGDATIDGSGSHMFRIDVRDFAEPGKGVDTYRMRVDLYDSGEHTLEGGNIQIH
jgi:hypothetical protein